MAEVGPAVGWGHLSRALILLEILKYQFDTHLQIVSRQEWVNQDLSDQFGLRRIDTRIVIADGLSLRAEVIKAVSFDYLISLSYISDVNEIADLVVAPALNGLINDSKYYTGIDALLCSLPTALRHVAVDVSSRRGDRIGICLGAADVDGLSGYLNEAFLGRRIETKFPSVNAGLCSSWEDLLESRIAGEISEYPHYQFADCRLMVTQGGLSSVELAMLGVPLVVRIRNGFSSAYRFLEDIGAAIILHDRSMESLLQTTIQLYDDDTLIDAMTDKGKTLLATIDRSYWVSLIDRVLEDGSAIENM